MSKESDQLPSLDALGKKIAEAKQPVASEEPSSGQGAGLAMRMGIELVSGVAVGSVAGLLLDRWLGTTPLLFLVCFAFGTAAGVLTMIRTVKHLGTK